jgi:hypothetical protein
MVTPGSWDHRIYNHAFSHLNQTVSETSDLYPNAEQIYERDKIQEGVFPDTFLN